MAELIWTRRYSFQSVHRLRAVGERRHGHQYHLELSFRGRDIDAIDAEVNRLVLLPFHGREISDLGEPTGENIVNAIHARLLNSSVGPRICGVCLQETRKNRFVSALTESRYV